MTIEQIKSASQISFYDAIKYAYYEDITYVLTLFIVIIMMLVLFGFKEAINNRISTIELVLYNLVSILMALVIGWSIFIFGETEYIKHWEISYVTPYMESVPQKEIQLETYSKLPHNSKKDVANGHYGVEKVHQKDLTPLRVSYYKDGEVISEKVWAIVNVVKEIEKPYIEVKEIEQNLGFNVNAGLYNVYLYTPIAK